MAEERYWFLGHAGQDQYGRTHDAEQVVSVPWWPEAMKFVHEEGDERVAAPMFFSRKEAAEEQLNSAEGGEAEQYLKLVEAHGAELVDRAYNHTAPLHVLDMDRITLADKLQDSDFLCVMVDGRMTLRPDFVAELERDV